MKKAIFIFALTALILMTGCAGKDNGSASGADGKTGSSASVSGGKITDIKGVIDYYNSVTEDESWQNETDYNKRIEALRLPEGTLESLSTEDLVEAILYYPLLNQWRHYGTCEEGIEALGKELDTMQELQKRSDAAAVLLKRYADQKVYTQSEIQNWDDEDTTPYVQGYWIEDIEAIITQDYILDQMTDEQRQQFNEIAKKKQAEKYASGVYSSGDLTPKVILELAE